MPGKHTPSAHKTQSVSEKLTPRKSASRPPFTFSVVQARPLGLSAQEFVGQIAHTATQLVHRKRELAR